MTAPLTPADCDLRDFSFMPLDVVRLRDSDLALTQAPEACWAAVLLWCASWHQIPAASLPDDDRILSNLAGYGRVVKEWLKVKAGAMHGWVKCDDGRLYHRAVAEKANDAWDGKLRQRWMTECARIKKHADRNRIELIAPTFEEWKAAGRPAGHALPTSAVPETDATCPAVVPKTDTLCPAAVPKTDTLCPAAVPKTDTLCPAAVPETDATCPAAVPEDNASKGKGQGEGKGDSYSVANATGGKTASQPGAVFPPLPDLPADPPTTVPMAKPVLLTADDMTKAELWSAGKSLLQQAGLPKAQCGSFVGKLVKDYGEAVVVEAVRSTVTAQPADPVEYLKACCQRAAGQRQHVNKQIALEQRNRAVADEWLAQQGVSA